jgi:hypothetical protein
VNLNSLAGPISGSDKQIIYNMSGAAMGNANLLWDYSNNNLYVGGRTTVATSLEIGIIGTTGTTGTASRTFMDASSFQIIDVSNNRTAAVRFDGSNNRLLFDTSAALIGRILSLSTTAIGATTCGVVRTDNTSIPLVLQAPIGVTSSEVGIGKIPTSQLDVERDINTDRDLYICKDGTSGHILIGATGADASNPTIIWINPGHPYTPIPTGIYRDALSGSLRFTVAGSDRIDIGGTQGTLKVTQGSVAGVTTSYSFLTENAPNAHQVFIYNNLSAGSYNSLTQAGDKAIIFTNGTSGTGNLVIGPMGSTAAGLRIDSNGNVGIGITESHTNLHITQFPTVSTATTRPVLRLENSPSVDKTITKFDFHTNFENDKNYNDIVRQNDKGIIFSNGGLNTGGFVIAPWYTSGRAPGIRIDGSSGNVGIGTPTPGYTLDVSGLARISGLPAFSAYLSNTISLSNPITFNTLEFGSEYNSSTGIFTAPTKGCYQFNATVSVTIPTPTDISGFKYCLIMLYKNGSVYKRGNQITYSNNGGTLVFAPNISCLVELNINDTVSIYIDQQNNIGTPNIVGAGGGDILTHFSGYLVKAL